MTSGQGLRRAEPDPRRRLLDSFAEPRERISRDQALSDRASPQPRLRQRGCRGALHADGRIARGRLHADAARSAHGRGRRQLASKERASHLMHGAAGDAGAAPSTGSCSSTRSMPRRRSRRAPTASSSSPGYEVYHPNHADPGSLSASPASPSRWCRFRSTSSTATSRRVARNASARPCQFFDLYLK